MTEVDNPEPHLIQRNLPNGALIEIETWVQDTVTDECTYAESLWVVVRIWDPSPTLTGEDRKYAEAMHRIEGPTEEEFVTAFPELAPLYYSLYKRAKRIKVNR